MRKLYSRAIFLALASISLSAAPAAAEEYPGILAEREDATVLQPLSPWNVDYADNYCRLGRMFGTDDDRHLLLIGQHGPVPHFSLTLAGSEVDQYREARQLLIGLKRDEPLKLQERFDRAEMATLGPALIITRVQLGEDEEAHQPRSVGIDLDEADTIDRVVLRSGDDVLSFETENMRAAFQALNDCTSDLLRAWGLEPEKHSVYTPPNWQNERRIARRLQEAYPRAALVAGESGIFRLRVIIEKDGSISDCFIENSTAVESLNSPACDMMRRAKFEPARDRDGIAMRSFYATTITYRVN
jgi:TonB family protein